MDEVFTGKWYPWYAAKALESEDFADLSLTEEGAYRRALDIAWKKGSLPANPAKFAAVIGKRCTEKIAIKVLQLFTPMPGHPSRVVNNTLERIRKEQEEKHRKRVGAGSQGGRPKGSKNKDEKSIDKALLNQSQSNASTDLDLDLDKEEEFKETHTHARGEIESLTYPLLELKTAFPHLLITPAMVGFLESAVLPADRVAWLSTIRIYQMNFDPSKNRYLPEKTANLLSVFEREKERLAKKDGTTKSNNYGRKRTDAEIFAESAEFYSNYPEHPA